MNFSVVLKHGGNPFWPLAEVCSCAEARDFSSNIKELALTVHIWLLKVIIVDICDYTNKRTPFLYCLFLTSEEMHHDLSVLVFIYWLGLLQKPGVKLSCFISLKTTQTLYADSCRYLCVEGRTGIQTMLQSRALVIALILLLCTTLPGKSEKLCCLPETKLSSTGSHAMWSKTEAQQFSWRPRIHSALQHGTSQ